MREEKEHWNGAAAVGQNPLTEAPQNPNYLLEPKTERHYRIPLKGWFLAVIALMLYRCATSAVGLVTQAVWTLREYPADISLITTEVCVVAATCALGLVTALLLYWRKALFIFTYIAYCMGMLWQHFCMADILGQKMVAWVSMIDFTNFFDRLAYERFAMTGALLSSLFEVMLAVGSVAYLLGSKQVAYTLSAFRQVPVMPKEEQKQPLPKWFYVYAVWGFFVYLYLYAMNPVNVFESMIIGFGSEVWVGIALLAMKITFTFTLVYLYKRRYDCFIGFHTAFMIACFTAVVLIMVLYGLSWNGTKLLEGHYGIPLAMVYSMFLIVYGVVPAGWSVYFSRKSYRTTDLWLD